MSRQKGTYEFSANFEVLKQAPLDARLTVESKSELTGLPFPYLGMLVAVINDSNPENNGLYVLTGDDPEKADVLENWQKIIIDDGSGFQSDTYLHIQGILSNEWVINHNMGKLPAVTVMDTTSRVVMANIEYIDNNNLKISFNEPFKGRATLN